MRKGVAIHTTGIIVMTVMLLAATLIILYGWNNIHQSEFVSASCLKAQTGYCLDWSRNGYSPDSKPSWEVFGLTCKGQPGYTEEGPTSAECVQRLGG